MHILLDDSLEVTDIGRRLLATEVVKKEGVGAVPVGVNDLATVILDEPGALDILVEVGRCEIVDGEGVGRRSVEDILSERDIGAVVPKETEDGRHNVGLRDYALGVNAGEGGETGGIEDDGHGVETEVGGEGRSILHRGVVGGDDEKGVLVPRLARGLLEETAEGVVRIGDGGEERV